MKRLFHLAAAVWLSIAGFAAINRAFEAKELAPMLGDDVAEFLGTASLAGFVFLIAFLWLGTRERALTAFEAFVISATWVGGGLGLALSMSGHPYLASWRGVCSFPSWMSPVRSRLPAPLSPSSSGSWEPFPRSAA